ncbi:hypothetical protein PBI_BIGNUZ_25 [Mycobacterium phage BigNuz]|uniref:Uncharacterized protein n=1 Tax=Mycobacterium phage BigNuz TaxID=1074309 RepID=G1JX40_9CAUD|nr:hypothetical protein PBI_BIGNUZ_25 [Mycobacterium phage BigNuz]AEL98188.1 hypothetical protein PBI_BIGNUZ_25 [Mycobacterium phage BigNuz]
MDHPDNYVMGIEKPLPVVAALGIGAVLGLVLFALLSLGFATGTLPLLEKLIDDRPDF